jgi:hypothetical protein
MTLANARKIVRSGVNEEPLGSHLKGKFREATLSKQRLPSGVTIETVTQPFVLVL